MRLQFFGISERAAFALRVCGASTTPPMTFLLVGNPTARSGRAAEHLERAATLIVERGTACERLDTEPEGRTVQLVRDAVTSLSPTVVVTFGGDGTFNEVAQGILASGVDVPLGMLPMGTANNQGRSFGLSAGPGALTDNLDVVFRGHVTALDVGHIARLDLRQQVLRRKTSTLWGSRNTRGIRRGTSTSRCFGSRVTKLRPRSTVKSGTPVFASR